MRRNASVLPFLNKSDIDPVRVEYAPITWVLSLGVVF
ncbi:hypothetical protein FOVG_11186 [Fusarium oxysporum f. sp. pisi HDV247]|uniref:Uncharacterized protein n=1 Tax=Fusarium oxysporum f. sp. pisi HDV247 TaxID=1080344 RepID=W9PIN8_FUSOX|nr:hypothetical protein FOVG_11186 [Fusarium oxysporum f. sp. pisi HDV247]